MSQSLSAIYLHVVFSTKDRRRFLQDPSLRKELHAYIGGISKKLGCQPIIVGGTEDHVHLLARFSRTITAADWIKEMKRSSTQWINQTPLHHFSWQSGYGAFSVSRSAVPEVHRYIAEQKDHHRTVSFQDEFRNLLLHHGLEWDERYVWD